MLELKIKKIRANASYPMQGTPESAGYDLCVCEGGVLNPGQTMLFPTGLQFELTGMEDKSYGIFIFARSGLAVKSGIAPANKVAVIDTDYRGEVMIPLHNHSSQPFEITEGMRVAQMVVMPVEHPTIKIIEGDLTETQRGSGGFGSTGL